MTPSSITIDNNHSSREQKVIAGIYFILKHFFPQEALFPRTIMTAITPGQIVVNSKEEIFARFKAANYKDCRINAFPKYTNYNGINRQPASFIFIDLDVSSFDYDMVRLEKVLNKTRKKIADVFGNEVVPTVLWTGGGYHVYLPLSGNIILEQYDVFAEFADWWRVHECKDLTSVFMGFAEEFLTGGKSDKGHTPTIKSCLLRVPYTINSKYEDEFNEVRILQSAYDCSNVDGDGSGGGGSENVNTAAVQYILQDFRYYLFDHQTKRKLEELKQSTTTIKKYEVSRKKNDRILKRMQFKARRVGMVVNSKRFEELQQKYTAIDDSSTITTTSVWVEHLLQIGIPDFRKRAVSLILAPYLIHKKKLPYEQAATIIRDWLVNKCDPLRHLDFKVEYKIKETLRVSQQSKIFHMRFDTLKESNRELHGRLVEEEYHHHLLKK